MINQDQPSQARPCCYDLTNPRVAAVSVSPFLPSCAWCGFRCAGACFLLLCCVTSNFSCSNFSFYNTLSYSSADEVSSSAVYFAAPSIRQPPAWGASPGGPVERGGRRAVGPSHCLCITAVAVTGCSTACLLHHCRSQQAFCSTAVPPPPPPPLVYLLL